MLGRKILHDITADEISRIQAKDLKKGKRDPQTINRYLAFLKHVLNLAMKEGLIDRNPVCSVKFSPEPKGKLRFLSNGELTRLKEVMAPEDWPFVAFALETGLRQSEQFKARWEWVDLERGIFTIPHDKAGRTRHVPLTEGAKSILRTFPSFMTSTYVFPSPRITGKPMEGRAWVKRVYMPALGRAKIEGANWHTLRHTFASRLAMSGVDIRAICELMGHTNLSTTMRYMHLSPGHLLDAINRASLGSLGGFEVGTVTSESEVNVLSHGFYLQLIDN